MGSVKSDWGFEYDPWISRLVLFGMGGLGLAGLVSNVLLLWILKRINMIWKTYSFKLITSLALADVLASLTTLGISVFGFLLGYPSTFKSEWHCRVFGFSLFLSCNISGLLISMVALDRYLCMCHGSRLNPVYIFGGVGTLTILFGGALGVAAYKNTFIPDPTYSICMPDSRKESKVTAAAINLLLTLPPLVIIGSYLTIFLMCLRIHLKGRATINGRLPLHSLLFMLAYLVCCLPKFATVIWESTTNKPTSMIIHIINPLALESILVVNPLLVMLLNSKVYMEIRSLLSPNLTELPIE